MPWMRRAVVAATWTITSAFILFLATLVCLVVTARSRPASGKLSSLPGPAQSFEDQYSLEDGEVLRFVPPPFAPQRRPIFLTSFLNPASVAADDNGRLQFYNDLNTQWGMSSAPGTLLEAVLDCGIVTRASVEVPTELAEVPVDGDWIIRDSETPDTRLKALSEILRARLKRNIVIEKQNRDVEMIVLRGAWNLATAGAKNRSYDIELYADKRDVQDGAGGGSGAAIRFLQRLEDVTRCPVVDQTTAAPLSVSWRNHSSATKARTDPKQRQILLDNLAEQTSLTLTIEKCPYALFVVSEKAK